MTPDQTAAEARRLAEAAVEARDRGDNEEAQALLARARNLDRDAVDEVLGGQKPGGQNTGRA